MRGQLLPRLVRTWREVKGLGQGSVRSLWGASSGGRGAGPGLDLHPLPPAQLSTVPLGTSGTCPRCPARARTGSRTTHPPGPSGRQPSSPSACPPGHQSEGPQVHPHLTWPLHSCGSGDSPVATGTSMASGTPLGLGEPRRKGTECLPSGGELAAEADCLLWAPDAGADPAVRQSPHQANPRVWLCLHCPPHLPARSPQASPRGSLPGAPSVRVKLRDLTLGMDKFH